jgi:hypothetical protein
MQGVVVHPSLALFSWNEWSQTLPYDEFVIQKWFYPWKSVHSVCSVLNIRW